jgi:O-antigen/teichoic acid export membrane protein
MRTQHAINNIILQTSSLLIGILLYFFITPYLVRELGEYGYGIIQLLTQTIGYFSIAEFGIGISISVLLYKELVQNNTDRMNAILSAAQRVYKYIGLSIGGVGFVFSFFLDDIFSIPTVFRGDTYIAFLFYLAGAAFTYFFSVPSILLNASQKGYKTYLFQLLKPILTYLLYFIFIYYGQSIMGISYASLLVTVWYVLSVHAKAKKEFPWLNLNYKIKDYSILVTSKYVFVEKLLMLVLFQTDVVLISYFLGVNEVASYALYTVFFYYLKELIIVGSNNLVNGVGELYQKEGIARVYVLWRDTMSIMFFAATFICIGLYFIFPLFFQIWMSKEMLLSNSILIFFLLNFFYIITLHPTVTIIASQNYYQKRIKGSMIEIGMNILFSIVLIQKYGVLGALMGTFIGHYFVNAWFIPMLFFKSVQQPFIKYGIISLKYVFIAAIMLLVTWLFFNYVIYSIFPKADDWLIFIQICLLYTGLLLPILVLLYGLFDTNFNSACIRIKNIVALILKSNK